MPAPIIHSTTGVVLSSDEISFVHQVASSFSLGMRPGWPKTIRREDPLTGATVEYHADKNLAYVTPGGVTDYVGMTMPNPVPYRGVSIGVVYSQRSGYGTTFDVGTFNVITSDGAVLASEAYNVDYSAYPSGTIKYRYAESATIAAAIDGVDMTGGAPWNGSGDFWMQKWDNGSYVDGPGPGATTNTRDHILSCVIPEDCIYPNPDNRLNPALPLSYYGTDGLSAQWVTYWDSGLAIFNARRKSWFLKNSTEFMAALKGRFQSGVAGVTRAELQTGALPASWDYQIKSQIEKNYGSFALADGSRAGRHTKMPIVMSITSAADVVVSDTSANLTQAGTKVTKRTTTFAYTDAAGRAWSVAIDGTLTQVVTRHTGTSPTIPPYPGAFFDFSRRDAYLNWYVPTTAPANETLLMHQFLLDRATYGVGLLWNGAIQQGYNATSAYGTPASSLAYVGYVPAFPAYSNTLVGTAPDIFLQYHNTVLPQYVKDAAQSSTAMNNSAMHGVTEVHISPVGLIANGAGHASLNEPVGMFSSGEDGTKVEIYGTAVYVFDWGTGSLAFKNWKSLRDANGGEVASKIIDLPAGQIWSNNPINCIVTYKRLHWKDVVEYVKLRDIDAKSGTFVKSDPIWWTIVQAIKAG